jgi:hypothetical protein
MAASILTQFCSDFKGFAVSREKQVVSDLLQYAKEGIHEDKL